MKLKKVAICLGVVALSFTNVTKANATEGVIVAGTTNDGDKLYYVPSSVKLENNRRMFQYGVIKQNGEIRFNNGTTPWCRYSKVQLDPRAIDSQAFFFTKLYNNIDILKTPGWFADSGYVVANSSASKNFLKAVCSI